MNPPGQDETDRNLQILDASMERGAVASAAIRLAASADPRALRGLSARLARTEFLGRLDDLADPQESVSNLCSVFETMGQHPHPVHEDLGVALANEPEFTDEPARLNYLLPVLAVGRPMSKPAAEIFRRTNQEGFFGINPPLLVENGSPAALAVFHEMIAGPAQDVANKIYVLHHSVVPHRTDLPLLQTCARLVGSGLPAEVAEGVIESIFDYQERPWYGNIRHPPRPPAWASASSETLQFVLRVATWIETSGLKSARLETAIESAVMEISRILATRTV